MVQYNSKEELIEEIRKRGKLFINEFVDLLEEDSNKLIEGVDRSPKDMIAYNLGWMNLLLNWEEEEGKGKDVITPHKDYKWNNLGPLYKSFYKEYEGYSLTELSDLFIRDEERVITLINSYSNEEFFKQGGRKWSSSTPSNWPIWKWVHINTVAPFKTFRSKIRKWKKLKN